MKVRYYPEGYMEQDGTPREIAQYQFEMLALNTLQSFKNLLDAIPMEMEKQKNETAKTIHEKPKRKSRSRKVGENETD